jgi:hypothetical protein
MEINKLADQITQRQNEAKDYLIKLALLNAKPPIKGGIIADKKLSNKMKWRGIKLHEEKKQTSTEFTLKQRGKDLFRTLVIHDSRIEGGKVVYDMNFCPKTAYNLINK